MICMSQIFYVYFFVLFKSEREQNAKYQWLFFIVEEKITMLRHYFRKKWPPDF